MNPFTLSWRYKLAALFLLTGLSVGFCLSPWGKALDRFLYDGCFFLRGNLAPPSDVVIVAVDEASFSAMGKQWPWPRSLHARLIHQLQASGARVIAWDILFAEPSHPKEDNLLAAAVKKNPGVILASKIDTVNDTSFAQESIVYPLADLLSPKTVVGFTNLPLDPDGFVRRIELDRSGLFALSLEAALQYQGKAAQPPTERSSPLYINFAGPPRTIRTVSYYQALDPAAHLPSDVFSDKVVFIGLSNVSVYESDTKKADHFPVPFTRLQGDTMSGVEILANVTANLLQGNAIRILPVAWPVSMSILIGLLSGLLLLRFKPLQAAVLAFALAGIVLTAILLLFLHSFLYLPILFFILPILACYSVNPVSRYWEIWKEKNFIRKTFATYLSPSVVNRLLASPDLLKLGGETREVTVLFLDLVGFTSFSERLDPEDLIALLNRNLGEVSDIVFQWEGMVDKYMGDAVMAVWGVPLPLEGHALKACSAACEMREAMTRLGEMEKRLSGIHLKARIGLNTGRVVAGNIGGQRHFNYTVLGNDVNLASRLEGVNKLYGTEILIGENTASQVREVFELREIDSIRVVGKADAVKIFELQQPKGLMDARQSQVNRLFERGLASYRAQNWQEARDFFAQGLTLDENDGPCRVFQERVATFELHPPPDNWGGVYELKTK